MYCIYYIHIYNTNEFFIIQFNFDQVILLHKYFI